MTGEERILKVIREEAGRGRKNYPIRLGTMTAKDECSVGTLELDKGDLMVNASVKGSLAKGDKVIVVQLGDSLFAIIAKVVNM